MDQGAIMNYRDFIERLSPYSISDIGVNSLPNCDEFVWDFLASAIQNRRDDIHIIYPYIKSYSEYSKSFSSCNESKIINLIDLLTTDFENSKVFIEMVSNFIGIVPFLNDNCSKHMIETIRLAIEKNLVSIDYIIDFIDMINHMEFIEFSDTFLNVAFSFIKSCTSCSIGTLLIAGVFADDLVQINSSISSVLIKLLKEGLEKDVKIQVSALFLMQRLSDHLAESESTEIPSLFNLLVPFLISTDHFLMDRSHKTIHKLFKSGVISEKSQIGEVIKQYSKYPQEKIGNFFKLLTIILDDQSLDPSIIQPVFDFLGIITPRANPLIQSYCLETYASLAAIDPEFLDDVFENELERAQKLLEIRDPIIYSKTSAFALAISKVYPETVPNILKDFLPVFVSALENKDGKDKKHILDLAQSIASMIEGGNYPDLSSKLFSYLLNVSKDVAKNEFFYLGSIVVTLKNCLTTEFANELFGILSDRLQFVFKSTHLNACLHMMKKLFTKYQINKQMVDTVIMKLLNGEIPSMKGYEPHIIADSSSMIFYFFSAYIKMYSLQSQDLLQKLVENLPKVRFSILPVYFEPISVALNMDLINESKMPILYETTFRLFSSMPVSKEDEYCSVVEALIQIMQKYPHIADPNALLDRATISLAKLSGVNEKGEIDESQEYDNSSIFPVITRLVFGIFASDDYHIDFRRDLLVTVLGDFPLSRSMDEILNLMLKIIQKTDECYKAALVPLSKSISELLMKKKSEQSELGIDPSTISQAKTVLKNIFKQNKLVEKQVAKEFSTPRSLLNKFNAILH